MKHKILSQFNVISQLVHSLLTANQFSICYSNSGVTASFGEMLLLIAIHFHSGQLTAVGELVCATLGMRVPVRPNGLARIKQAFTQEIFTEQVRDEIL